MTHPQWKLGPMLENPNITSAAILYDFIPLDYENNKVYFPKISQKRAYTSNLLWLKNSIYIHLFPAAQQQEQKSY